MTSQKLFHLIQKTCSKSSYVRFELVIKMQCRAITSKATPCSRKAVGSDCYCKTHIFGNKPPSTPRIDGWYSSSTMRVPSISSEFVRRKLVRDLRDADGLIQKRIRFLTLTEYFLKYPEQATQLHVEACLKAMDNEGKSTHLAYYREYFARKLSQRHRQEARQKYAESIIRESDLGQDIAEVVARFVS